MRILSRNGAVFYECGAATLRECVEAAVRADVSLTRAYLVRADLSGANLSGAKLAGAYLTRANLTRANADRFTWWPDGFDPAARGVTVA